MELVIYPNPCNFTKTYNSTLKILLPQIADVYIYNIQGYKVFEALQVTGRIEWDGKNREGEDTAPGVYFYIIEMSGERYRGRILTAR